MPDDHPPIPPQPEPPQRPQLSVPQRLALVYERLRAMPPATSAEQAFNRLGEVLDQVEDQHSGVPKNPNPGLKWDGRMYHPRADFTTRDDAGGIHATTKGNTIYAAPNGELTISSRRTGEPVFRREGAGPRPDTGQAAQAPRVEGPSAEAPSKSRKTGPGRRAAKRLEALYQRDDDPGQGKGPARRPQKPPAPRKPDGPSV